MSRVSVCITCYNEADFVEEAVRSVLGQTAADRIEQIIIVDDGSTDGSPEKLQRLAEETGRILLITQENRGLPAARNRAMREATGDLIAFLDGDDVWAPTKIEKQMAAFGDPLVGLVYSDYVDFLDKRLDRGMLVCVRRLRGRGPSLAKDYYLRDAPIMPSTAAIRREVLERIGGFDEGSRIGEDTDYWMRTLLAGFGVCHTPGELVFKRRHQRNVTANLERFIGIFEQQTHKFAEQHSCLRPLVRRRLSRCYAKVADSLMANGRIAGSVRYLLRALRHDPGNLRGYIYALALPAYAIWGPEAISSAKRVYHLVRARVWLNGRSPESMQLRSKIGPSPARLTPDWSQLVATRRRSPGRTRR
jgi:glycosyltransferase involved in cell wall biosynthesis